VEYNFKHAPRDADTYEKSAEAGAEVNGCRPALTPPPQPSPAALTKPPWSPPGRISDDIRRCRRGPGWTAELVHSGDISGRRFR
jgi:hypothetical protein